MPISISHHPEIRSSLPVGQQLCREKELPFLLLLPHYAHHSHALCLRSLPTLRPYSWYLRRTAGVLTDTHQQTLIDRLTHRHCQPDQWTDRLRDRLTTILIDNLLNTLNCRLMIDEN